MDMPLALSNGYIVRDVYLNHVYPNHVTLILPVVRSRGQMVFAVNYTQPMLAHPVGLYDRFGICQQIPTRGLDLSAPGSGFSYVLPSDRPLHFRHELIRLAELWIEANVDRLTTLR